MCEGQVARYVEFAGDSAEGFTLDKQPGSKAHSTRNLKTKTNRCGVTTKTLPQRAFVPGAAFKTCPSPCLLGGIRAWPRNLDVTEAGPGAPRQTAALP